MKRHPLSGFTLIELSIVLVIIGLIVGGVLTGRALIRTTELQSILTDKQKYVTAVNTFRGKYNAIPGDMTNATSFWGTDPDGCPGTPLQVRKQATCNGNGNFLIEGDGVGSGNSANTEHYRAWQQLANAGLIDGFFTGETGPYSYGNDVPGLNVPAGKIPGTGFDWVQYTPLAQNPAATWGAQQNAQYLLFGGGSDLVWDVAAPALTPEDAFQVDKKADDGMPKSGTILASSGFGSLGSNCATVYQTPIVYDTTTKTVYCTLVFEVKSW